MAFLSHNRRQNDSPNPLNSEGLSPIDGVRDIGRHFGFIRYITRFDIYVLCFMVGIGLYFIAPFEANPNLRLGLLGGAGLAIYIIYRRRAARQTIGLGVLFIIACLVGFLSGASHTASVNTQFLPEYDRAYTVTGWIEGQSQGRTGPRFMIRVHGVEGIDNPPKRLRVRSKGEGVTIGDFISIRAVMSGPPHPATPGGYNSRRAAYFKGLGGYGYAIAPFEATPPAGLSFAESCQRQLTRFRYALAQRIKYNAPEATAGLQAALMTGLRQDIAPEQVSALRASGLAHILAISGLHMALLAGSFYSLISLLLASIPVIARGRDVRKFAAFAAIIVATLYLLVSGASVATQRAYIMAVIMFLAVILDRQALSTRSVSFAALITLLLRPESLLSVGFQMSFAAVLALVVVYRYWADWQAERGWIFKGGIFTRLRNGFVSLSVTSLVAGLATGLFAIMHFQRWAKYGLMGNLAAMPVFTFLVMPMALVTFLALPFGLERYPLWLMGLGLEQVLWVATHIEGLSGAMLSIKKPPSLFIPAYAICFLLICLGRIGFKVVGGVAAIILAFIWAGSPTPIVRVSDQGRVTWQSDEGEYFTLNKRADRFGREQFLRGNGELAGDVLSAQKLDHCDSQGCVLSLRGQTLAIIETPDLLPEACETANLIILQKRAAGPRAKFLCNAKIIDPRALSTTGAVDLYVTEAGWEQRAARRIEGNRPWD